MSKNEAETFSPETTPLKVVLVALNARHGHTNLAIRCLEAAVHEAGALITCPDRDFRDDLGANRERTPEVLLREYTINDRIEFIAGEIYELGPDLVGFSCYIWNIEKTMAVIRRLRAVIPKLTIVVGGPEVAHSSENFLKNNPDADRVFTGEGEPVLPEFLKAWRSGQDPAGPGRVGRAGAESADTPWLSPSARPLSTIEARENPGRVWTWVDPYRREEDFNGKYVYLETARGCPFSCAFCLSAASAGVRYLEPERIRPVLRRLFRWGARTVKLVDRTFNANKKHAFHVLDIFREEVRRFQSEQEESPGGAEALFRVHCEMAGDLLDEDWMIYLAAYPRGMIQLEIGVQSTHAPTLQAIGRRQDLKRWGAKVQYLQKNIGIPIHMDLIAGLPCEGLPAFLNSIDTVLALRPNRLQIGFLKVLKGTPLAAEADRWGLVYSQDPPYEVLQTADLDHHSLLALHRLEDLVEKYYNSGFFRYGLEAILENWERPTLFFQELAVFWKEQRWFERLWHRPGLMDNLRQFLETRGSAPEQWRRWREALRFDYYCWDRPGNRLPAWLYGSSEQKKEAVGAQGALRPTLPDIADKESWRLRLAIGQEFDRRQWSRATALSCFDYDVPQTFGAARESKPSDPGAAGPRGMSSGPELIGENPPVWYLFFYGADGRKLYFRREDGGHA